MAFTSYLRSLPRYEACRALQEPNSMSTRLFLNQVNEMQTTFGSVLSDATDGDTCLIDSYFNLVLNLATGARSVANSQYDQQWAYNLSIIDTRFLTPTLKEGNRYAFSEGAVGVIQQCDEHLYNFCKSELSHETVLSLRAALEGSTKFVNLALNKINGAC